MGTSASPPGRAERGRAGELRGWYQREFVWYSLSPSKPEVVGEAELHKSIVVNNIVAIVLSMDFVSESEFLDSCDLNEKIDDVFSITCTYSGQMLRQM